MDHEVGKGKEAQDAPTELAVPPRLRAKLESFQKRLWSIKIAEGALAGIVGLALSYLAVFLVDRFIDTPAWVRLAVMALGFAVPAIVLPLRWKRWVTRQRTLEQVARLLKRSFPRLGDELLGVIELARSPAGNASPALVAAALRQVDERLADQEFDEAIPARRYGSWLLSAVTLLAVCGLLLAIVDRAADNALARWISPWLEIDRYTFAKVDSVPDSVIVPLAEPFDLSARIADDAEWKPDKATIRLPGKTKLASTLDDGAYPFDLPPQREEGEMKLRVGDDFRGISVVPLPRPELTSLQATLRLPDYLRYSTDPTVPVRGGTLSVVRGATTRLEGSASRELASVESPGIGNEVSGDTFVTDPISVEEPTEISIRWSDVHGLEAKSELRLRLDAVDDQEPDVFARQIGNERIVLVDEVVSFDLSATDDFGVKNIGLEWVGTVNASRPAKGEKPVAAGEPEAREVETRATFSAAREGVPPQTVQLRAFAEDFFPNRPRSYSPAFVLHVLSPEDHAEWLTQEFGKWFRNAREVYEREQQLHETNRALRSLGEAELDAPENRKRLEEQASAETANARRLESLTEAGRDLVRQATKNDEFDAERLESWATMMRSLDEISKQRMPSVADLLRQASRAEGGPPQRSETDQKTPSGSASSPGNDPEGNKPEEPKSNEGGDSAPSVGNQQAPRESEPKENPPSEEGEPSMPAPSITDRESEFPSDEKPKESSSDPAKQASSGALRLPATTLGPGEDKEGEEGEKPTSESAEKLDQAIDEQEALLAAFAEVTDQLQQILSSLEASTFVKRLKLASRKQTEIASSLNSTLGEGFGLPKNRIAQSHRDTGEEAGTAQEDQSAFLYSIQTDLEAYFQRKQDDIYRNVLDQMKASAVVSRLKDVGRESRGNLPGRAIAAASYWADTFDRWAEELVAASDCESSSGGSSESLPPEIVLEIMKVLQEEMYLRDETREIESTRPLLPPDVYESKARPLELTQAELRTRIDEVIEEVFLLENASENFGKELQLLRLVSDVMREARAVLARPDTGPEAIAAQTEAIELLLQSKRQQNDDGGGGGGSNPGGGGSAGGNGASLADIQPGPVGEGSSAPAEREVDQATGKAGRELPEEFRRGLDQYFNELESTR